MEQLTNAVTELFAGERTVNTLRAIIVVVLTVPLARLLGAIIARSMSRMLVPQQIALLRRVVSYGVVALGVVMGLRELGFDLTALLGAAGIVTVAIGFASQTVASNLISGLFLIGERGFEVGSVVTIGTTSGEVLSIDTLSVKLRTFDNLLVRLPNENLIKSEIRILSGFPIRRIDIPLVVSYSDDLGHVERTLQGCARRNPLCLEEPAPLFMVLGFGDNGVSLQFSPWAQRERYVEARTAILKDIKGELEREGLTFALPQREVHMQPAPVARTADTRAA